ncbi:hypothetical protein Kpho02_49540 [Kitasatospora phosalacinea]|uniref:Uncharacterized protein n=1 Tax=Kitasatospora phosalacinea TaxID=2065 RepID=A0A9W6QA26_9ACTN|nr:hypothetical protein [Kitasatospora phosalacinea]GLW72655.1 hypothetical protein Kpho02_49540 [Kitasatospora phosalacinea]
MTTPPVSDAPEPATATTEPAEPAEPVEPTAAPETPAARRWVPGALKVAGLVVAIVVALLAAAYLSRDTPAAAKAGDCAHNAGTDDKPDVSLVDCHSADAEFTVLKVVHGADEQDCQTEPALVATYVETRRSSVLVLCLGVHG